MEGEGEGEVGHNSMYRSVCFISLEWYRSYLPSPFTRTLYKHASALHRALSTQIPT